MAFHGVNGVRSNTVSDWRATTDCASVYLDRVDAGDVMHDDADLGAVMGNARLPLSLGKSGRKCGQCRCASFKTRGEGFSSSLRVMRILRSMTRALWRKSAACVIGEQIQPSNANRHSHKGGGNQSAAVLALVVRVRQFHKLAVEFLRLPVFPAASTAFMVGP